MRNLLIGAITLMTLGSGLLNLYSVSGPAEPLRIHLLHEFFPMEFSHLSAFLTLVAGFVLVVSSVNIFRRKRRAYQVVLAAAGLSVLFHLTRGLDYEEAAWSLFLAIALLLTRSRFTVESRSISTLRTVAGQLALAFGVAIAYGFVGFWFLDRREFGINFDWLQSLSQTLRFLSFRSSATVQPQTRFANWFIDSLHLISATAIAYGGFSVFRPAMYRWTTAPNERTMAERIVQRHGRSPQDYFKYWPDKSFCFSRSGQSFLAYRVAAGLAIVLGDPVGPDHEMAEIIEQFTEYCSHNDWAVVFYQARPDLLGVYRRQAFKKLKIGDCAIVDLRTFTIEGKAHKTLRSRVRQLEASGIHAVRYDAPAPWAILDQAKEVSNEWLRIPGRRERGFTLGAFDLDYLRSTTLYAALDADQRMMGFVNTVPTFRNNTTTIDLMRRRADSPNGIMDYLFVKVLLDRKADGCESFDLGMAPMSGFREHEQATAEERAVHYFFQHLNFIFSFTGLYSYKAKFASFWEPRYVIYRNVLDLPRVAVALGRVSSLVSEVA